MSADTNRNVPQITLPPDDTQVDSNTLGIAATESSTPRPPHRRRRSSTVNITQESLGTTSPPPSSPGLRPWTSGATIVTVGRRRSGSVTSNGSDTADRVKNTQVHCGRRPSFLEADTQSNPASDRRRVQDKISEVDRALTALKALRKVFSEDPSQPGQEDGSDRSPVDVWIARETAFRVQLTNMLNEMDESEQSERLLKSESSGGAEKE